MEPIILKKFELLPEHLKIEVNLYIDKLLAKTKLKNKSALNDFFGVLSESDAEKFKESLKSSRKIDHNEW
jgi:hypothetical protein